MATPSLDREALEAEIDRVRSLGLDELRTLWRRTFRRSPPVGFPKDFIARAICWHIQEQALGGLARQVAKLLNGLLRGDRPVSDRFLKPGTVLVREHQDERHTVTVVPGGYVWRETTYASLSVIAGAITGTSWNGPRFFGLRAKNGGTGLDLAQDAELAAPPKVKPVAARHGVKHANARDGRSTLREPKEVRR